MNQITRHLRNVARRKSQIFQIFLMMFLVLVLGVDGKEDGKISGKNKSSYEMEEDIEDLSEFHVEDNDVELSIIPRESGIPLVRHDEYSNNLLYAEAYQSYIQALAYPARLVVRPDSSTVAIESKISFFCRADGNPLPSVIWRINGKSINDHHRISIKSLSTGLSTLRIENVTKDDNSTVISCSADNGVANPVVAEAVLTVIPRDKLPHGFPQIDQHPTLKSVEQGKTAFVSCKVSGDPRAKVLWLRDLIPIDVRSDGRYSIATIGNPGALMIQQAREDDQGKYECIARNSLGVAHSKAANLYVKVRRVPPYFSVKLEREYVVGMGGSINLTCVAVGYPWPRVFWKKTDQQVIDDPSTAPMTKNVLTLTNVEVTENFTCVAVSNLGNIEATTTVIVKELPPPPIDIMVSSVTSESVVITWKPPNYNEPINKYIVKFRLKSPENLLSNEKDLDDEEYADKGRWKSLETLDTSVVIGNLVAFQTYEFTVQSGSDIVGPGLPSISVEAQTMTSPPSTPPANPQARSLSRDSILVKWGPTDQPNGVVTGYKVYYTLAENEDIPVFSSLSKWNLHEAKADEFMTTIYSLNPDSRYFLKVVASNSEGDSPPSQLVTVSTRQGIPGQPALLKVRALDSRRMQLSWEKPLFSSPISGYTVRYNTTDGEKELTITSPHEKHIISGLHPDKYYSFRVAAYSDRGQGEFTEPIVTKTIASIPITAPTILTVSATSSRSVEVKWKGPDGKGLNGGTLTAYRIAYRKINKSPAKPKDSEDYDEEDEEERNSSEAPNFFVVRAETTKHLLTDLQPYSTYQITVAASTIDGYGPDSSPVNVVKTLEDVPSAPQSFQAELSSATSVKLTWEAPKHENGVLIGFYLHFDKLLNGEPVIDKNSKKRIIMIKDSKKRDYEMESLDPNTEYSFRLNAFNRLGDGEFSERRSVVTQGIAPSPPEIVAVSLDQDEPPVVARIEWKTPRSRPNETPIDKYNLVLKPQGYSDGFILKKTVEGAERSTTISGLLLGVAYDVLLSAENREGHSQNATETIATPIGIPEGEPINVQYEISDGKIVVSWRPPAEQQRNGNITSYKAVLTPMDASSERFEKTIQSPHTSATFEVNVQRAYLFKVAASTMKGAGPYSPVLTMNPDLTAVIGPPTNVYAEALSNSSVVVQWDFESVQADSFVVKYSHEPEVHKKGTAISQQVEGNARSVKIHGLTSKMPYSFCVLAVKNNRQGQCSEPPVVLKEVRPEYIVQNFRVLWKTGFTVKLAWDYNGPRNVQFYLNHTGHKDYYSQDLSLKTLTTPGYETTIDGSSREYLWQQLRPYMKYKFEIGVKLESPGGRKFWPVEVHTQTDATAPPYVEAPTLMQDGTDMPGQRSIRLKPSSEEYGEIREYYLIVVPANYSADAILNLNREQLDAATNFKRNNVAKISVSPAKRLKRKSAHFHEDYQPETKRHKRADVNFPGVYVTAKLSSHEVKEQFNQGRPFVVGDSKTYEGFVNYPLEQNQQYRLMMRAFAKNDVRPKNSLEQRPPMGESLENLYRDSHLSEAFTTRGGLRNATQKSSPWLGACIAFLVLFSIVAMLICWWLRCNKKSAGRHPRHGSITKVALTGNIMNGTNHMNGETSKLLNNGNCESINYGRAGGQVMNPYDTMDLYPLPAVRHVPVPVPLPSLPNVGGINISSSNNVSHPSIPIAELANHIERLRQNNNQGFQNEFESVETGQTFTWEHSSAECNKHKNRYANVAAYDHTRVILSNDDYINANYIDGYDKSKSYIATQGPLPETFADFWRMVWEEGSATIVMLTNLEERSRIKCDQYWPSRGSATYGEVMVTLLESVTLAHYTMRTMRLQVAGEPEIREIKHLQYTAWPDHGVPDHPTPFLIFLKRVKTLNPVDAGPIISHCSAGIGRTGAFIVIDCMLERLRYENTVDIYGCVTTLRAQRSYMVQTEEQYIFIHDAVLDAVNSGSTEVPASRLHQHVQALMQPTVDGMSGIDMEFRHLTTLKWTNNRCQIANLPVNRPKNRVLSSVPYDSNRVILQMIPGIDGSDYINASWIDGYKERGAYMAMQAPLNETAADFWRAIWEHQCSMIVMLVNTWERGQEQSSEYWPLETGVQVGKLVVEPIAEYNMEHYILREFRLTDFQTNESRTVRHFQFIEWPEYGRPDSAEHFIDFVSQVHRAYSQFGVSGPITVHCTSGAGRTAVFISLAIILDRMRAEHVVDVFTTVKLLRTERQNMIQDNEQYQFLYQATFEYLASYDNFVQ